ncbi:hypothetical protein U1Q18_007001 [Sarracenia purpurea var. burkii]
MKENRLPVAMVSAEGRRSKRAPWSAANGCAWWRKLRRWWVPRTASIEVRDGRGWSGGRHGGRRSPAMD